MLYLGKELWFFATLLYNQDGVGRDWEPPFVVWITGCFRSSVPSALTLGCQFFAFPSKSLMITADLTQTSRVPDSVCFHWDRSLGKTADPWNS